MTDDTTIDRIREFILDRFPNARERGVTDQDSLLDGAIVDSLGVLDIVAFLESEFELEMSDDDLVADSFESIESIASLVEQKQQVQASEN